MGHTIRIASGAGAAPCVTNGCELVLKVRAPQPTELAAFKPGSTRVGMLNPFDSAGLERLAAANVKAFALEPRLGLPARRAWTFSPRKPTSPATRP